MMNSMKSTVGPYDFLLPEAVRNVREFCQPLLDSKKINSFHFARVFDNGKCQILAHNVDSIKYLFDHKVMPTATAPQEIITDAFWFLVPKNEETGQVLTDFKSHFNIGTVMDYIDRYHGYYEMYCFGTPTESVELASNIFLNERDSLFDFVSRFRRKADLLCSSYPKIEISLPEAMKPNHKGSNGRMRDPLLKKAVAHIEDKLFGTFELEEIAKAAGLSKSSLMRTFKREMKSTPYSYIRERRLEEAMKLLTSGRYSVSEVANLVGYGNFGAFTDGFKAKFGKVPSLFK